MGLDQYLYAKRYASQFTNPELNARIIELAEAQEFADSNWGITHLEVCVGYWRKANAIHNWFVENCQGGEDDCREAYVGREQLFALLEMCEAIIANPSKASDLLPTRPGFFFGDTDYEEYYMECVTYTRNRIRQLLDKVPEDWDFYYSSSW